jgi:hypothetical protein
MAVTVVHLARAPTRLLRFGPGSFNPFSMTAPHTFTIVERESVLAVVLVAIEVFLWDKEIHYVNDVSKIRKVGLKTGLEVDIVLTCHIIGFDYSQKVFNPLPTGGKENV